MLHAADLGFDEVEVVEEPLGGRGEELAAVDVIGQDAVGIAQNPRVLVHPGEELLAAVIAGSLEREARGEPARALLEALDAQELGAEGAFSAAALPGTEEATQGAGHELAKPTLQEQFTYGNRVCTFHSRNTPSEARRSDGAQCRYSERRTPTPSSRVQTFAGSNPPALSRSPASNGLPATPRLPVTSNPMLPLIGTASVRAAAPPSRVCVSRIASPLHTCSIGPRASCSEE